MIQDILDKGRREVEIEGQKLLQGILDDYGSGIQITQVQLQRMDPPAQVVESFRDVQRAEADKERQRNEAQSYRNDILPRARGQASKIVQEAKAYKSQTVAEAQGETSRFLAIYKQYRASPEVTRQRLYIETMQDVLSKNPKVIIDSKAGSSGVVPYLPLPEIGKRMGDKPGRCEMNRAATILGIIVVALGIVAFSSVYTVRQTEQALVLQFGEPKRRRDRARPALQVFRSCRTWCLTTAVCWTSIPARRR